MSDHIQDDMDEDEANLFMERSVMCEEVTLPGVAARRIARYISNLRVESDNDLAEVRDLAAKLMALNEELVAQNKALKDATPSHDEALLRAEAQRHKDCVRCLELDTPPRHDEALLRIYLANMPLGKYHKNDAAPCSLYCDGKFAGIQIEPESMAAEGIAAALVHLLNAREQTEIPR